MPGPRLSRIVRGLSAQLGGSGPDAATDAQLVERFVADRDEAAFAALVERHGPVVLGVSRQVLRDAHAAEDVFQATFLLLARKAGTLRTPGAVRGWLYETAVNLARTARAAAARRAGHEQKAANGEAMTESPDSLTPDEFRAVLHEEVSRLPEKYRLPVLMCHLENMTHDQAAAALGCPVGTVRSRLSRARDMLRRRLERRGVTLAALAVGSLSGSGTMAVVPPALVGLTVRTAVAFAATPAAAPAGASGTAWALAEAAAKGAVAGKLRLLVLTVLVSGLTGAGLVAAREPTATPVQLALVQTAAQPDAADPTLARKPAKPVPEAEEEITVTPVQQAKYVPPPQNFDVLGPHTPSIYLGLRTAVEDGRLWAYLNMWVLNHRIVYGDSQNPHNRWVDHLGLLRDPETWKWMPDMYEHKYPIYTPPAGRAVVRAETLSYVGMSLDLVTLGSIDQEWREKPRGWGTPGRVVFHLTGEGAKNKYADLGCRVIFPPTRVTIRGPARK